MKFDVRHPKLAEQRADATDDNADFTHFSSALAEKYAGCPDIGFLLSVLFVLLLVPAAIASTPPNPRSIYESSIEFKAESEIDKLVMARLSPLHIEPALCSDSVFIRRAFLDVIGTLPTAREVKDFIADADPKKRSALIDRLLERDEFADYWAMKWGDALRIKAEFPVNLWPNAAQAYHRWVRACIATNKPYDEFARDLLTSSGSNFRVGPVNFYRAIQNRTPEGIASAVALTLMGARAESWPTGRLEGVAVFFSQVGYKPTREWKEEVVFWDPYNCAHTNNESAGIGRHVALLPSGAKVTLPPERDPREIFANWLTKSPNPWFTRAIVNRVWCWLLGRGIVHEADDIRDDNPPVNPELLDFLEKDLIASHYDLKHLYRLILNSQTYQVSSVATGNIAEAEKNFGCYMVRRLDAEVLIDAINKITGASDLYTSAIPEPFTYIPADMPAIAIGDGSITSPFLALFGRSARATGTEDERINKMLPAQWLHLLNSSHVQRKLEQGPALKALLDSNRRPAETVKELYLTILSRYPTTSEIDILLDRDRLDKAAKAGVRRREEWIDVAWALINSTEFLYRH